MNELNNSNKGNELSLFRQTNNEKMQELVIQNQFGKDVTTSLIVAKVFGKRHDHVLRDIANLSCSQNFNAANFGEIKYIDNRSREQRAYEMTKDGFSLLVMGYNGAKAGEFKEKFINEFNKREILLNSEEYILMRSQQILKKRLGIAEEKIKQLEKQNAKLQPKANFADAAFECVTSYTDIGQAAKVLNLPFGRNTLFKKLREDGIFFASKNEPKQRFVDAKYFKLTQLPPIERENHAPIITMKVLCTQKGLAYINHLYGGNKTPNKIAIIK